MDGFNGTSGLDGMAGKIADYLLSKGVPVEGVAVILANMHEETRI